MTPVEFEGQTTVIGAPDGVAPSVCGVLPVRVGVSNVFVAGRTFTSYWKPTQAEIDFLVAGGCMEITIHSNSHPPMLVHAGPAPTPKKKESKDDKEIPAW